MRKIFFVILFIASVFSTTYGWRPFEDGFYIHPDNMPRFEIGFKAGVMQVSKFIFLGPYIDVNGENASFTVHGSHIGGDFDTGGFYFTYWQSDNLGYQFEILYYEKSAKTSAGTELFGESAYNQVDLGYLEFPFFAKFSILRRMLSVYGGGFVAANLYSRFGENAVSFGVAPVDLGLLAGMEFAYFSNPHMRYFVDIRYDLSVVNVILNGTDEMYNGSLMVTVGSSVNF